MTGLPIAFSVMEPGIYEECPFCEGHGTDWDAPEPMDCINCDGLGLVPHEC